jgi:hypothetical protein
MSVSLWLAGPDSIRRVNTSGISSESDVSCYRMAVACTTADAGLLQRFTDQPRDRLQAHERKRSSNADIALTTVGPSARVCVHYRTTGD